MFCRLIIWRAKLDFDIIEILFKMDSGKKIKRDAICFRFLFPHPFMFCGFEFIRFFFSKIKPLSRCRLYNFSCISEHVAKRTCIYIELHRKISEVG